VSIILIFIFVLVFSAFMNNTPLVILAIPLMQSLAHSAKISDSRVLMSLSFVAILGGMTTLVGSSTNLLVSSTLEEIGYDPLTFFQFFVPGAILAGVGFVYVLLIVPFILPNRKTMVEDLVEGKEFIAEIDVKEGVKLIGEECVNGEFPSLPDLKIKLIQRSGHLVLPPFEGYKIEVGDTLIISATRETLTNILARFPGVLLSKDQQEHLERLHEANKEKDKEEGADIENSVENAHILAEIMIPPGSRYIDMTVEQAGIRHTFGSVILGIQRRARAVRRRFSRVRLEQGDVLLVAGSRKDIYAMKESSDVVVLSGSKQDIPLAKKAPIAMAIFMGVIALAAFGVMSIPVASIIGAVLMVATNCLNVRQATRALDRKIFLLVGSMLALGTAMDATGGALAIADSILSLPIASDPLIMVGILFGLVAVSTNILSNNACAILFTPIAVNLAINLGVDPMIFAITVIFAANCSFASPIGYQTNLLVMGPGHYQFSDFMKAGIPLMIILWVTYIFIAKLYYGIG
ncbi:MAG: SLC13 family permease, partial [Bdellovibrionales bacterium]